MSWSPQKGVGLIEILVTLLIMTVGLLGVAALQFTGSFANTDANGTISASEFCWAC